MSFITYTDAGGYHVKNHRPSEAQIAAEVYSAMRHAENEASGFFELTLLEVEGEYED